jgi:hypothetical protein
MKARTDSVLTTKKWSIGRTLGVLFVGLCIAVITLNVALPHGSSAAASPIVFKPTADTFAKSSEPDRNYGSASRFDTDAKPIMRSYLRFQLSGVGQGSRFRALLRLYVTAGSSSAGLKLFTTAPSWNEMTLTWNTQPALGQQIAELAPTTMLVGSWVEIDMGESTFADGVYNYALTTASGDRLGFLSRTQSQAPQLVLTPVSTSNPTATPQNTQPTATPQNMPPTATPSAVPTTNPGGCLANEIFVDAQDWWMQTPGATNGKEFGHLHTSYCFPHKSTISGKMTLHIRSTLHHNPGQLRRLSIQIFAPQIASGPKACGDDTAVFCMNFNPPRTCPIDQTCRWEDVVTFDTAVVAYDGWQEVRIHGIVTEPDGTDMRTSSGLHIYLQNGHPVQNISIDPNSMMARGWYTNVNYTTASIISPPMGPVSGIWEPTVRMDSGAGGLPVTGWYAALDTDFHNGIPGIPLCAGSLMGSDMQPQCGTGPYRGKLKIDTTKLANGWHRLFLKADARVSNVGSTHSGVLAIYFEVKNGGQASVPAVNTQALAANTAANAWICKMF